jgi:hypothetical protein
MKMTMKSARWIFLCILAGGCGSPTVADYIPNDQAGKQAVETALSAWQRGEPMALIENQDTTAVQPQDSDWKRGKKLVSYVITDELPSDEGPKQFAVRLTLERERAPIETIYFVLGKDPLWVFRDRDYKQATGTGM